MNLATIPGYREAIAKERFNRTAAFAPLLETVCGVRVLPLTFGHLAILETVGSPFLTGGNIGILDVGAFLWIVSPGYVPRGTIRAWWKRRRFLKRLGKTRLTLKLAVKSIVDYIADAEADMPGSGSSARVSSYSHLAGIVDILASEYGWSERAIMRLPIKRALQFVNRIRERHGDKCAFNPSDIVRQKWLDEHQPERN